jgi:hypothetical protein
METLHIDIDFGLTAMGLNTNATHMTHIFRTSGPTAESDVPEGLKESLA